MCFLLKHQICQNQFNLFHVFLEYQMYILSFLLEQKYKNVHNGLVAACHFVLIHFFVQQFFFLCTTQIIAPLKVIQSLKMTPVYVAQCHLQSACNVPSDSFESGIFTDRSRMLKMRTAGFSSTLHLIDPLIAAMG